MSNPLIYQILKENPRLLSDGAVLPYIRENNESFGKYFRTKKSEGDSAFSVEEAVLDQNTVAGFLDSTTKKQ